MGRHVLEIGPSTKGAVLCDECGACIKELDDNSMPYASDYIENLLEKIKDPIKWTVQLEGRERDPIKWTVQPYDENGGAVLCADGVRVRGQVTTNLVTKANSFPEFVVTFEMIEGIIEYVDKIATTEWKS